MTGQDSTDALQDLLAAANRRLTDVSAEIAHIRSMLAALGRRPEGRAAPEPDAEAGEIARYLDIAPDVLEYRRMYHEAFGTVAPPPALPKARAWPLPDEGTSYRDKLVGCLDLSGLGAEIGPLNIPLVTKADADVLYVDHLPTEALKAKYSHYEGLVDIDRPMGDKSLRQTLEGDAPLDFVVASQVMEHVPDPIGWLGDLAAVLKVGGRAAISLPDRRLTFDLYRRESRPSDFIAAHVAGATVPDARAVYDHFSQVAAVSMQWAVKESVYPDDVVHGMGAVVAPPFDVDPLELVRQARDGAYHDVHAWVYTPVSFVLCFAHLAGAGLIPFRCSQFYPTNPLSPDRGSSSLTCVFEKAADGSDPAELRRSFLTALG